MGMGICLPHGEHPQGKGRRLAAALHLLTASAAAGTVASTGKETPAYAEGALKER